MGYKSINMKFISFLCCKVLIFENILLYKILLKEAQVNNERNMVDCNERKRKWFYMEIIQWIKIPNEYLLIYEYLR